MLCWHFLEFCQLDGSVALIAAIRERHVTVAEALIARGADLNATDSDGDSPLHLAVQLNLQSGVQALLASQAEVNVVNVR